jgi:hypothetical protein
MPPLDADSEAAQIVEIIAAQLTDQARPHEIIETLISRGKNRNDAKRTLQMARVGFDLALSRGMGLPIQSLNDNDPIVAAAAKYGEQRIGKPDCPRFLAAR